MKKDLKLAWGIFRRFPIANIGGISEEIPAGITNEMFKEILEKSFWENRLTHCVIAKITFEEISKKNPWRNFWRILLGIFWRDHAGWLRSIIFINLQETLWNSWEYWRSSRSSCYIKIWRKSWRKSLGWFLDKEIFESIDRKILIETLEEYLKILLKEFQSNF